MTTIQKIDKIKTLLLALYKEGLVLEHFEVMLLDGLEIHTHWRGLNSGELVEVFGECATFDVTRV